MRVEGMELELRRERNSEGEESLVPMMGRVLSFSNMLRHQTRSTQLWDPAGRPNP